MHNQVAQGTGDAKKEFQREVQSGLMGRKTEGWETVCFKRYRSQIPVVEQAIKTGRGWARARANRLLDVAVL